jgi:predicted Zn-dependent protease
VARARGDRARYLESLRLATEKEQRMLPFSGPPERLLSLELLGTELLADGRNAEAARAFEDVLRKCPNRSQALLGLARAKAAAGDRAGADDALAKVRANWTRADAAVIAGLKN